MTVEKSHIESQPQAGLGWYKRVFAWLMAQATAMIVLLAIAKALSAACFRDRSWNRSQPALLST